MKLLVIGHVHQEWILEVCVCTFEPFGDTSMNRSGVSAALAAAAALVTAHGIAEEVQPQDCSFFKGQRLVTVGGHEDQTPVIPLFADVVTYDLSMDQACHTLE